jgi:hypothetical protein
MQACAPRPRDEAHLEAFRRVGALYDLKVPVAHGCEDFAELMCIVAVVGPDELQPGKELLELLEQIDGAVAILPIGRMRDRVQKPAARQEKVTPPRRASSSIPEAPVVDLGVRRMRCAKASSAQRETRPAERVGLPQALVSKWHYGEVFGAAAISSGYRGTFTVPAKQLAGELMTQSRPTRTSLAPRISVVGESKTMT